MSIFGRLRNLGRGMWLTRGSDQSARVDAALEAELRDMRAAVQPSTGKSSAQSAAPAPEGTGTDDSPAEPATEGPQRDDKGNIVKTL